MLTGSALEKNSFSRNGASKLVSFLGRSASNSLRYVAIMFLFDSHWLFGRLLIGSIGEEDGPEMPAPTHGANGTCHRFQFVKPKRSELLSFSKIFKRFLRWISSIPCLKERERERNGNLIGVYERE